MAEHVKPTFTARAIERSSRLWIVFIVVVLGAICSLPVWSPLSFDNPLWVAILGVGGALCLALPLATAQRAPAENTRIQELIFHDRRPIFITDASGEVQCRNSAARDAYGDSGGPVLEQILKKTIPSADAVIFRMQAKAVRDGAAKEEIVARRGGSTLHVHRLPEEKFMWSVEVTAEKGSASRSIDKLSLPMLTAGNSGVILYMNEAMTGLVGKRVKTIDRLFAQVPKGTGGAAVIQTKNGLVNVQTLAVPSSAGRVEYFIYPSEGDGTGASQSPQNFELLEEFPVALVRLAPNGTIKDANRHARELLQDPEISERRLSHLVEGLGRSLEDWINEAAEGRGLHKPEMLRLKGKEDEVFLQVTLGRVLDKGEVGLIAMIADATELKTLEAQFVQSQKMQAIGQLAGGVAHDFNNLLTAISGHCDLLMLRHDPGDLDFADLEQINQNANRAASLVGQLLAFSRKQNLQLQVIDLRDTLSDLTHLLNRLVGAQINLSLTHDPQLQSVRADRRQLEQVVMNLVVNARDAMSDGGGEIQIETRNVMLQSDLTRDRAVVPRGNYVLVKVRDNGVGIAKEKISKIFEPFFTTKKTGDGTGLGLSTAYGIVKQTGGFIFVDSELGKGTEFTLFIPAFDMPEPVQEVSKVERLPIDAAAIGGTVLLVEDEAPVRAFASRALKLRGFHVIEASSGEEALHLLQSERMEMDIVVSDVVMPGMDGPSWVKEARKTHPGLRVVFVSGYAEENFSQGNSDIPNSVFLPKPFSLNELAETVQAQLVQKVA